MFWFRFLLHQKIYWWKCSDAAIYLLFKTKTFFYSSLLLFMCVCVVLPKKKYMFANLTIQPSAKISVYASGACARLKINGFWNVAIAVTHLSVTGAHLINEPIHKTPFPGISVHWNDNRIAQMHARHAHFHSYTVSIL